MTTGTRIKECREASGLSVDQVATALGKNRATVYRYENGYIDDIPISIVYKLSEILHTTAAHLMGWDEDPVDLGTTVIDYESAQEQLRIILTEPEYAMLRAYQAADDRAREDALALLAAHRA